MRTVRAPRLGVCAGSVTLRPERAACGLDIRGYRLHELCLAGERALVAEAFPELDRQPLPVEVAVEIEQIRLDAKRRAAVVRVDADRARAAVAERLADVDPSRGQELIRIRLEVRRREAEELPAPVA